MHRLFISNKSLKKVDFAEPLRNFIESPKKTNKLANEVIVALSEQEKNMEEYLKKYTKDQLKEMWSDLSILAGYFCDKKYRPFLGPDPVSGAIRCYYKIHDSLFPDEQLMDFKLLCNNIELINKYQDKIREIGKFEIEGIPDRVQKALAHS